MSRVQTTLLNHYCCTRCSYFIIVLEHLLVHASLELLAEAGAAGLAMIVELAVPLEVRSLHDLPELKAWRPSSWFRRLRAWCCGRTRT